MMSEYRRARRSYVIVSGLLLAWELVGVTVSDVSIANFRVNLATPQVTPHILAIVTFYLLVRFTVEWLQCTPDARRQKVAQFDAWMTHFIGASALVTYMLKSWADIKVGERIGATFPVSIILGFMTMLGGAEIYRYIRERQTDKLRLFTFGSLTILPAIVVALLAISGERLMTVALSSIVGAASSFLVWRALRSVLAKRPPNSALEPKAPRDK